MFSGTQMKRSSEAYDATFPSCFRQLLLDPRSIERVLFCMRADNRARFLEVDSVSTSLLLLLFLPSPSPRWLRCWLHQEILRNRRLPRSLARPDGMMGPRPRPPTPPALHPPWREMDAISRNLRLASVGMEAAIATVMQMLSTLVSIKA